MQKTTKDALLELLKSGGGQVFGQEAAKTLGVTRAAVWKAAGALRQEGLRLQASPGGGYRAAGCDDRLTQTTMRFCLDGDARPVKALQQTGSTNLDAKRWAMEGAPHGSLVVAESQTEGRGRLGRSFESPPGGLYMSVVLRPKPLPAEAAGVLTAAAAVAVCRAVRVLCGLELAIKWVNDLYYKGKKCCGILTEAATGMETGQIEYLVVGIGLNVAGAGRQFSPRVARVAGALYGAGAAPVTRPALAAAIHAGLLGLYAALPRLEFMEEYRARSMVLGGAVEVLDTPPYSARALRIDDAAGLVVQTQGGEERTLRYGEISVRAGAQNGGDG